MKKTLFSTILFFIIQFSASAQDDLYVIEQAFPVAIRQLTVVEGWTLRLVHTPGEDSTRVAVVTPCPYYFAEGKEPAVVALEGNKLHILTNRTMPPGTTVEVRYPEPLDAVMATGHVHLDTLHMQLRSQGPRAAAVMVAGRNSRLEIDYLEADGDLGVECRDEGSRVEIGSLRCRQFLVDERHRERVKVQRLQADSLAVVPHHWWHDINYAHTLLIGGRIGAVTHTGPRSPYTSTLYVDVNFNIRLLKAPLSPRWRLFADAGWGFDFQLMAYDVTANGNSLVFNPSPTVDHRLTTLEHAYLALPLTVQFRPRNRWARAFSNHLDITLTPRLNIIDQISNASGNNLSNSNINLLSRFQMRLALANTCLASNSGGLLSGGITWELFVDLLPTYRPSAGADGMHQIGFAIHF